MSIEKIPLWEVAACLPARTYVRQIGRGKPEVGQDGVRCVTSIIHLGLVGRHRTGKEDGGGREESGEEDGVEEEKAA